MLPLSDNFKENLSLRALKYVYSKVVEYEQITTFRSKWGKGANHVTIIRSLYLSRIDYHHVHSNMSIQR